MTSILQRSQSIGEPSSSSSSINYSPKPIATSLSTPSSFLYRSQTTSSSRTMGRHKHPLLINTTTHMNKDLHQRSSPQSADAAITSLFSQSFLKDGGQDQQRRRTMEDRERSSIIRRNSVSPARSIATSERNYSTSFIQGQIEQGKCETEEEEQDADSLEARLRFPTFARRPITFEGGNQKRKHSPVRSPLTVTEISFGDNLIVPGEDQKQDLEVGDIRWRNIASKREDGEQTYTDEEEVLFSLDEEVSTEGLSSHLDDNEAHYEAYGDEETVESVEDVPSSLPLSLPFSYSAYSNRRVSDHSSADLDMIWDEEEEEALVSAPNLRSEIDELPTTNKGTTHHSVGGVGTGLELPKGSRSSSKREQPIAIVGGFNREGSGSTDAAKQKSSSADTPLFRRSYFRKPLVQRSNSTPRDMDSEIDTTTTLRRLSFARRSVEKPSTSSQQQVQSSQAKLSSSSSNSSVNLMKSPSPPTMALAHRESTRRMSMHKKLAEQVKSDDLVLHAPEKYNQIR